MKQKRTAKQTKRQRERAMPAANAFAFTVRDAQAMGAPGRTKLYELDKKLIEAGRKLLFKDAAGRTMVYGDVLRELYGVEEEITA